MKRTVFSSRTTVGVVLVASAVICLTGCRIPQPPPVSGYTPTPVTGSTNVLSPSRLRVGELLTVTFTDVPNPIPPFEGRIREDGKITLTMNQEFEAAGKTIAELEREIRERYVPKYFQNLTVTVRAPERFFYVDGQVRMPSRQPYYGEITVLGAIAAAGGFTDFAQPKKVRILRADGKVELVDCKRAQRDARYDVPIYPGDRIIVPRRFW
ncbi:MAG: polysaccharide biosynthesis/export family protein [Verrucomicrobiae bacterium]|nr:polysaccharide biosynthesis/export family protein [Verrucomicrobiae bacterium]MDW7979796.1 polysaccharide biosynthesis/export family protein [Verrucomicrobiales bacterium]